MKYRLYVVRIFVRDWPAALVFYKDKLGMQTTFESEEMGWAQLDTGGSELALERIEAGDDEGEALVGRYVGVSLEVDDIIAVHKELVARGVEFVSPPTAQPWGGVLAHFKDLEGNVITLLGAAG